MKQQTPMSRVKATIENFKLALGDLYTTKTLNKSAPKYDPHRYGYGGSTKGVQADFVLLFGPKYQSADYSTFAFSYFYIDKETDEHTVIVSIKPKNDRPRHYDSYYRTSEEDKKRHALNKYIIASQPIPISVFKEQLKALTNLLKKEKTVTENKVLELIGQIFHNSTMDLQASVRNAKETVLSKVELLTQKCTLLSEQQRAKRIALQKAMTASDKAYKRSKVYKDLLAAQELVKSLQADCEKAKANIDDKNNVQRLTNELNALNREHQDAMQSIEYIQRQVFGQQHPLVAAQLARN